MTTYYSIRHTTSFTYDAPIHESFLEVRSQPRSEGDQRCLMFVLKVSPKARILSYSDFLGNRVHHFDIPGAHDELNIVAEATVEVDRTVDIPESLPLSAWAALARRVEEGDFVELLMPSTVAQPTPLLLSLMREMKLDRSSDPLTMIHRANRQLGKHIKYAEGVTKPESPIDTALKARAGVGQDFVHIFIAMIRQLGIPCRYVSGYRYAPSGSTPDGLQKTHAWAEALLPELGWVGFDPAIGVVVDECYIRSAIGRDYADIPPTRGVYKGEASSQIAFSVSVTPTREPSPEELTPGLPVQE